MCAVNHPILTKTIICIICLRNNSLLSQFTQSLWYILCCAAVILMIVSPCITFILYYTQAPSVRVMSMSACQSPVRMAAHVWSAPQVYLAMIASVWSRTLVSTVSWTLAAVRPPHVRMGLSVCPPSSMWQVNWALWDYTICTCRRRPYSMKHIQRN